MGTTNFSNMFGNYNVPSGNYINAQQFANNGNNNFRTNNGIFGSSEMAAANGVNMNNANALNSYQQAMGNWNANKGLGPAPVAPQYQSFNPNGYNAYWNAQTQGGQGFQAGVNQMQYGVPNSGGGYTYNPATGQMELPAANSAIWGGSNVPKLDYTSQASILASAGTGGGYSYTGPAVNPITQYQQQAAAAQAAQQAQAAPAAAPGAPPSSGGFSRSTTPHVGVDSPARPNDSILPPGAVAPINQQSSPSVPNLMNIQYPTAQQMQGMYPSSTNGGSTPFQPLAGSGIASGGNSNPFGAPSANNNPIFGQSGQQQTGQASSVDQAMAQLPGGIGGLQNIVSGKGNPFNDTTSEWQAMIGAQKRNIDEGAANLQAQFADSGVYGSSAFGTAAADYQNQATAQQNALLAQLTQQGYESAQGRNLTAAGDLGSIGANALSQLSNQGFTANQATQAQAFQAAMGMLNTGAGAAGQLNAGALAGVNSMNQGALQGMGNQYQAMLMGLGSMAGASNSATQGLYGTQSQAALQQAQQQMMQQQLGLQGALGMGNLYMGNEQLGSQLGGQQYQLQEDQLNRLYQQWQQQQPYNNPYLGMMYSGATAYPPMYTPGYSPGVLGSILGGIGGVIGGIGALPFPSAPTSPATPPFIP